jgi:hypothetical protein
MVTRERAGEWARFVDALGRAGQGELVLKVTQAHVPWWLRPVARIRESKIYFAVPADQTLELGGDATEGVFSSPPELQPPADLADDPHVPLPIRRLALRDPLRLDSERRLLLRSTTGRAPLTRGWLVCWLEGTTPH